MQKNQTDFMYSDRNSVWNCEGITKADPGSDCGMARARKEVWVFFYKIDKTEKKKTYTQI